MLKQLNFNSLVISKNKNKSLKQKTKKNIYMKIEFQNSISIFVLYNGHQNCLDKSLNVI